MTGPSPFDIARAIGQNIGQYQQDERESSIIDRILNQAQSGGGYQQAINQLLSSRISPQRQQMALGAIQNLQQQQSAANMFGTDFAGLSPDLQKAYLTAKGQKAQSGSGSEFAKLREKAVADYYTSLLSSAEEAQNVEMSSDRIEEAIKGDIEGPGFKALAKNNPYTQILVGLTPEEQTLISENKLLLEGTKGLFGPRPTEREIMILLQGMLPSIGKTREANLASLDVIRRINDLKIERGNIAREITQNGTLYVPNLEDQVNRAMQPRVVEFREYLKNKKQEISTLDKQRKSGNKRPTASEMLVKQAMDARKNSQ